MLIAKSLRTIAILAGLALAGSAGFPPPVHAASPPKQTISVDAGAAVAQMGKSLQADQFSFQARTLRVYAD
jgi:hypothetical protein